MTRILLLGGTLEAAELAAELIAEGHLVTTSLAGRTKEPKPLAGSVRIGGFGGANGLHQWLVNNKIEKVIDATHPFAQKISQNAKQAARLSGVVLEIRQRPPWQKRRDDSWIEVADLKAASNALPAGASVFLALGSQHIEAFTHRDDARFLIRMIDMPEEPLPFSNYRIITARPSLHWQEEARLLKENEISHIIARNSGGLGAYAKIEAARNIGLSVIMIESPKP